jgi:hypothetical protein
MREAHARARSFMNVVLCAGRGEAWGWHGRTLSQPVIRAKGLYWLRLAAAQAGYSNPVFWNGAIEAEAAMPGSLHRPRLRNWHDWCDRPWQYRAELYDLSGAQPVSASPVLSRQPVLPASWWTTVRTSLEAIRSVPTSRCTITRDYLRQAMPRFLGTPIDTDPPIPWTTAHGDFHFANITAPDLEIFDFEGWGLAPAGYDAATLRSYSLLVPAIAARIDHELADVLNSPAGRHAELVAITEVLHATARGEHVALVEPLRQRASTLLGRDILNRDAKPADPRGSPW